MLPITMQAGKAQKAKSAFRVLCEYSIAWSLKRRKEVDSREKFGYYKSYFVMKFWENTTFCRGFGQKNF